MKLYKHCDLDEAHISLHDCRAVKAKYKNNTLSFLFDNGFWLGSEHKENNTMEPLKTGPSKVQFQIDSDDEMKFYVYVKKRKKTIREELDTERFVKMVNSRSVSLEFLYQYKNSCSRIIECCMWSGKDKENEECEIRISPRKVFYMWDKLSNEPDIDDPEKTEEE